MIINNLKYGNRIDTKVLPEVHVSICTCTRTFVRKYLRNTFVLPVVQRTFDCTVRVQLYTLQYTYLVPSYFRKYLRTKVLSYLRIR